jgi:hypothetical protein
MTTEQSKEVSRILNKLRKDYGIVYDPKNTTDIPLMEAEQAIEELLVKARREVYLDIYKRRDDSISIKGERFIILPLGYLDEELTRLNNTLRRQQSLKGENTNE